MNLEDLYNDVKYGVHTFNDKKLRRSLMPAMASALSGRTQAGIRASAGITQQGIATRGSIEQQRIDAFGKKDVAGMKEEGATHRTNLTKDAQILMRRLMESGANFRQLTVGDQATDKRYEDDRNETRMLRDHGNAIKNYGRTQGGYATDYSGAVDENLGVVQREDVAESGRVLEDRGKKKPTQFGLSNLFTDQEEDDNGPLDYAMSY